MRTGVGAAAAAAAVSARSRQERSHGCGRGGPVFYLSRPWLGWAPNGAAIRPPGAPIKTPRGAARAARAHLGPWPCAQATSPPTTYPPRPLLWDREGGAPASTPPRPPPLHAAGNPPPPPRAHATCSRGGPLPPWEVTTGGAVGRKRGLGCRSRGGERQAAAWPGSVCQPLPPPQPSH